MIDSPALLKDLKAQLKLLVADLRARAEDTGDAWGSRLTEEYAEARRRRRTGHSWPVWRDNEVDQAAVAWIIATTFLRFCEDNDLLAGAHLNGRRTPVGWIAGPGNRTALVEENLTAYFGVNPTHNRRHWLLQGLSVLAAQPAGKSLVDPNHNPVWTALISPESAAALIEFWRRTNGAGELIHDFRDDELGTRFLGDLYQDLSEHAKKTYALLQTPEFVEEFILDQTLTPALKEFGHEGLKLIDPTCGSGHFLLGAFHRLVKVWKEEAPGLDVRERVRRAMDSIHGVDLNPFAVAIARFRLTVAGINVMGERSLAAMPALGYHLAIGDSLLGESGGVPATIPGIDGEDPDAERTYLYDAEDLADYVGILQPGQYHLVVGNPPYITVKDKVLNALYRKNYETAAGKYALSAPFMELFFRLSVKGGQGRAAGYVGQITANSFMKREFGKKLIEDLLAGRYVDNPVDLAAVIDTSGAYIPHHGTPTVILIGRRRYRTSGTVRAVLGVRGDPGQPDEPSKSSLWVEMVEHLDAPGYDGEFISVTDLDKSAFASHPWSLSGGGAVELFAQLEDGATSRLYEGLRMDIGFASFPGNDEPFFLGRSWFRRHADAAKYGRDLVVGEVVRDWEIRRDDVALTPYSDAQTSIPFDDSASWARHLWLYRRILRGVTDFDDFTQKEDGQSWWTWYRWVRERYLTPLTITFASISTHNHFVLDRGGKVFKQSAPVIKLPKNVDLGRHVELISVLNSSIACFWLKQVSHAKTGRDNNSGGGNRWAPEQWMEFYDFAGTKVEKFPLPPALPIDVGRVLDTMAHELGQLSPQVVIETWITHMASGELTHVVKEAEAAWVRVRERMIFEQEELDWEVYRLYGLLDEPYTYGGDALDQLALGQRSFEILLARAAAAGKETAWFTRHGSTSITEIPAKWPADYAALIQNRLDLIESDPNIRLVEKPEYKRRWAVAPWSVQLKDALESAILDRLEQPELWRDEQGPQTKSVAELADLLRGDAALRELAAVLTDAVEPDLAAVLGTLVGNEAVPYLAAQRYKPDGLEKYRTWEEVWEQQRREDAGGSVDIAVPPKYSSADFRKPTYWKARGKLDVPKERFILYPDLRREADSTPVLGWAGWDHRDQALALGRELPVQESLGADDEALTPLVAGLVELEPWLHQWYAEEDPAFGASPAAVITQVVDQYLLRMEKTRDDVTAWTPPAPTRGRRPKRS